MPQWPFIKYPFIFFYYVIRYYWCIRYLLTCNSPVQVKNAQTYGAIGAIIYSDPKDYAPLGANKTFPETPFLPSTGVQRGSVFLASGDPLTPGRPSLPGIYRNPRNDSQLPKIPAHPMSYGDAVHFLSKMQGNVCLELVTTSYLLTQSVK